MGGFGSGGANKRLDLNDVNNLLYTCYHLTLRLLQSKTVSNDKKLEVASRLVQRIIPERVQVLADVRMLSESERLAELDNLSATLSRYRPVAAFIEPEKSVRNFNAGEYELKRAAVDCERMLGPEPSDEGLPVVKVTTLSALSTPPPDTPPAAPAPPL